jgi:hypothetical protein
MSKTFHFLFPLFSPYYLPSAQSSIVFSVAKLTTSRATPPLRMAAPLRSLSRTSSRKIPGTANASIMTRSRISSLKAAGRHHSLLAWG